MENILSVGERKAVKDELSRGREFANQLRQILIKSSGDVLSKTDSGDLIDKIKKSFTNTISVLIAGSIHELDEVSQMQQITDKKSNFPKSDIVSGEDGRGCYKRRGVSPVSWKRDTPTVIDDGHAWRKYGQKVILNAKHPRHYYRCTNKFDQGCKAIKHVQKMQDDPPLYRTAYYGHHTCRDLLKHPEETFITLDSLLAPADHQYPNNYSDSSIILSFANTTNDSMKLLQEPKTGFVGDDDHDHQKSYINQTSFVSSADHDYFLPTADFISSAAFHPSASASHDESAFDHGDIFSNLFAGSIDFDNFLQQFSFS
ncbi:putative WRKY transcription factor [Quillaja saponaria]|uniref:WRKY transcription factor n=1 Tax=Quillaja saponaria TaxID=32244 RepID=A0AAD7LVM3_QUISA|nr:putative WRKY transcription factor [Quillaja saponaria]